MPYIIMSTNSIVVTDMGVQFREFSGEDPRLASHLSTIYSPIQQNNNPHSSCGVNNRCIGQPRKSIHFDSFETISFHLCQTLVVEKVCEYDFSHYQYARCPTQCN